MAAGGRKGSRPDEKLTKASAGSGQGQVYSSGASSGAEDLSGTSAAVSMMLGQLTSDLRSLRRDVDKLEPLISAGVTEMGTLKTNLGILSERVDHKPGKGFIVSVVLGGMTGSVALLTFLSKIGFLSAGG